MISHHSSDQKLESLLSTADKSPLFSAFISPALPKMERRESTDSFRPRLGSSPFFIPSQSPLPASAFVRPSPLPDAHHPHIHHPLPIISLGPSALEHARKMLSDDIAEKDQ